MKRRVKQKIAKISKGNPSNSHSSSSSSSSWSSNSILRWQLFRWGIAQTLSSVSPRVRSRRSRTRTSTILGGIQPDRGWRIGGAVVAVAIWLSAAPSVPGQLISAPFGLKWGETEGRIMAFAAHAGSGPQLMSGNSGRETIDIGGPFPNQRFQRLGFTFQSNRLVQVAVYYSVPENMNEAGELLTGLRGEIEQSFGPGQLLETGTEKNAEGYLETRRVFRWEREGCAIWLVSMEVQNAGDAPHIPNSLSEPGTSQPARRGEISVVYANLGLGRQLEIESASTERLEARIHRSIPVAPTGAIVWPCKSLTTICTSSLMPSLPK